MKLDAVKNVWNKREKVNKTERYQQCFLEGRAARHFHFPNIFRGNKFMIYEANILKMLPYHFQYKDDALKVYLPP